MRRLLVVSVYYLIFGYAQIAAAAFVFPDWRPDPPSCSWGRRPGGSSTKPGAMP